MAIMAYESVCQAWRPHLRFSVRGLIIVVLIFGGWLGWTVRSARMQREAVAAIREVGGTVHYDWEWQHGKFIPGGKPWAQEGSWPSSALTISATFLTSSLQIPRSPDCYQQSRSCNHDWAKLTLVHLSDPATSLRLRLGARSTTCQISLQNQVARCCHC
jgi:hypothetical protein